MLTRRRERDAAGPRRERGARSHVPAQATAGAPARPSTRAPVDWIGPPAAEGPLHIVVCISVLCSKPSYSGDSQGSVDHIQISHLHTRAIHTIIVDPTCPPCVHEDATKLYHHLEAINWSLPAGRRSVPAPVILNPYNSHSNYRSVCTTDARGPPDLQWGRRLQSVAGGIWLPTKRTMKTRDHSPRPPPHPKRTASTSTSRLPPSLPTRTMTNLPHSRRARFASPPAQLVQLRLQLQPRAMEAGTDQAALPQPGALAGAQQRARSRSKRKGNPRISRHCSQSKVKGP